MPSSYMMELERHRRLGLLQLLAESANRTANAHVLRAGLESMGVRSTYDQIRTALTWLGEQGLVELDTVGTAPVVVVATLTMRGLDVASGDAVLPGVARPLPVS